MARVVRAGVGYILFKPREPLPVTLTETTMTIAGARGASVALDDIESVSLGEGLPTLSIRRQNPLYTQARTKEDFVLFNLDDPQSTRAPYAELSNRLKRG